MKTGTFTYASTEYCKKSGSDPSPTISGTTGGTFSSTAGLSIENSSTGEIDLSASAWPGSYTISYIHQVIFVLLPTGTSVVTILPTESAAFTYRIKLTCQQNRQRPNTNNYWNYRWNIQCHTKWMKMITQLQELLVRCFNYGNLCSGKCFFICLCGLHYF